MRCIALLLASLALLGCGNGSTNKTDPHEIVAVLAPPSITALSPASTRVNSVPFFLTVNGANFGPDALAFLNGVPQHTVFITSKQLMIALTPTDLDFAGQVPVYVRTGGQNSNTVDFDVTPE